MSGHSKWSKVKHQKAVTDSVKGKLFTKAAQAITLAVREGGGVKDPNGNFKLRLAIEKARAVNTPKENIDRAITRAAIITKGGWIETILYEGFGPGGAAILIESATDNRQRTVSTVRNTLETQGGSLGSVGSVQYLFDRVGMIVVPKEGIGFDALLEQSLDAGVEDCVEEADGFVLFVPMQSLFSAQGVLEKRGIQTFRSDVVYRPKTTIALSDTEKAALEALVSTLEDLDDVQRVFTNAEEV